MTVTLEPELESELRHQAAEQGQEADAYLSHLIKKDLRQPAPAIIRSTLTKEESLKSSRRVVERQSAKSAACDFGLPARRHL